MRVECLQSKTQKHRTYNKNPKPMKRQTLQACCALALSLLASSAQAQFTYTGNSNINSAQTYDGLGVDSALNPKSLGTTGDNDYIGNGRSEEHTSELQSLRH